MADIPRATTQRLARTRRGRVIAGRRSATFARAMAQIDKPSEWFDRVLPETVETQPEKVDGFSGTLFFNITGDEGGTWTVHETYPDGRACSRAFGETWIRVPKQEPGA